MVVEVLGKLHTKPKSLNGSATEGDESFTYAFGVLYSVDPSLHLQRKQTMRVLIAEISLWNDWQILTKRGFNTSS